MVDEPDGVVPGNRAEHDGDDGPSSEDVNGGELVALAHALEVADVEAVETDELAWAAGSQAEPEGFVLPAHLGQQAGGGRRDDGCPGQALAAQAEPVGDQVLLHRGLGDREATIAQAISVFADSLWSARARPG